VSLLGSDPHLQSLWTAHAECVYPENLSTDTVRVTDFAYDADGHVTQVNCPEGVIDYEYDPVTGYHTGTCTTNSYVQYGYDELGRLKKVIALKRSGYTLPTPEVTTYAYTAVGSRASITLPNGVITSYQYDELNRLTNLTHSVGGTNLLASYSYQLHSTGRRTNALEILKTEDSDTPWITNTLTWAYDGMYRLTNEVSICSTNTGTYRNAYQYDKVGNRFAKIHYQNGNITTITNVFNDNDQLLKEVTKLNSSLTETNFYAYDVNGSLIAKTNVSSNPSTNLYGYDLKNKLSAVTNFTSSGNGTNTFLYNDQGIRVHSSALGGITTHYLIDANNHTGYQQILEELSAPGATASKSYLLGDDVLAQCGSDPSALSFLLYDGHGSTRQLADLSASVSSRYNYDAYGIKLDSSTSSAGTSLLYCGEQLDEALGMYNLRARYYDPYNGRLNSTDRLRGSNDDPQSLHKYAYAGCDPTNGVDPSGDLTVLEALVVAGLILTGISFLYHSGSAVYKFSHGNARGGAEDLAWAMCDLLFLGLPLVGPGVVAAKEGVELAATTTSMLQATVRASAVWGYASSTAIGYNAMSSGGGNSGPRGGSSSAEGSWGEPPVRTPSENAAIYEQRIAHEFGDPRPKPTWEFNVGDVWFDGVKRSVRKLLEAKGPSYERLFRDLVDKWINPNAANKVGEQLITQAKVARQFGYTVEWHVAEQYAAERIGEIAQEAAVTDVIEVIFTPF
jgi:RHS repeat-associated protein